MADRNFIGSALHLVLIGLQLQWAIFMAMNRSILGALYKADCGSDHVCIYTNANIEYLVNVGYLNICLSFLMISGISYFLLKRVSENHPKALMVLFCFGFVQYVSVHDYLNIASGIKIVRDSAFGRWLPYANGILWAAIVNALVLIIMGLTTLIWDDHPAHRILAAFSSAEKDPNEYIF